MLELRLTLPHPQEARHPVDTTPQNWTALAEARIRMLRGVNGVRIRTEGDEIREIHISSQSSRPAKQIVRDVQTVLLTDFERAIDHRVVSVAFTRAPVSDSAPGDDAFVPRIANGAGGRLERSQAAEEPTQLETPAPVPPAPDVRPHAGRSAPVSTHSVTEAPVPRESGNAADRIRFKSVNLHVSGRRARADVELHWMGVPRTGSATGWGTREGALRLIAQATLATVQEFLDEHLALNLDAVEVTRAGRGDVVVVALELLAHRTQKSLAGCCPVGEDVQEAVVLATLSALNRIVGGLPMREPTEYVLRPASS